MAVNTTTSSFSDVWPLSQRFGNLLGTRSWVVLTSTLLQFVIVFFILRDKWPSWHRIFWVYLLARHPSSESSPGMCHGDRPGSWKCSHPWDSIKTSWRNTVYTSPGSEYPNLFGQIFTYFKSTKRQKAYFTMSSCGVKPTHFSGGMHRRVRPLVGFPKGPIFLGQKFLVNSGNDFQFCGMNTSIDVRCCDLGLWRVWGVLKF